MPWGIVKLWSALLAAVIAFAPAPAAAQAGVVGTRTKVCIARAAPGMTARALFAAPARFDCAKKQRAFGPGDYWALSAPLPPGTARNWPGAVRVASLWQERLTLYALYADGAIRRYTLDAQGTTRHIQLGAIIEQPLAVRDVPVTRLLWHVEGSANLRGILLGASIARPSESARSNLVLGAIYAAFGGLAFALLMYNLALWGALRYRFQLSYCAMLAVLLIYALSSSGALAWIVPQIANNDRLRINYLTLALSAISALAFARSFFEPRVFEGWLGRYATIICGALIASSVLFVAFAPWHIGLLDRLYTSTFVALLLIVPPVLVRAWSQKSRYLWLFALAWAAPFGFATLRTAGHWGLVDWSFWVDNSTILSMSMEALLSSLAIAYRIRLLSRERDEAREQEIAARLLADIDPLTGLLNRRAFLREAIGRVSDQLLIVADIDHFKAVNDTLGHDGGDEVLRIVARALRDSAPEDALIARIGGEEFAIVTVAHTGFAPRTILERIRSERMPFDLTVTASLGTCAGVLQTEEDWKRLYRNADEALFRAKAAGRDRVRETALAA